MLSSHEVLSLSNINLLVVDKWLAEGREIDVVGQAVPTMFHIDNADLTIQYLNEKGCEALNVSPEEILAMGDGYMELYVHPETLSDSFPRIKRFYEQQDYYVVHTEMVKIWYPLEREYKLCLTTTKLSHAVNGLITTTQPIEELDFVARKIQRLAEEQHFVCRYFSRFQKLTKREREILTYLAQGLNNPAIALKLNISRCTVEQHRKNIKRKLMASSFVELLKYAQAFGLV